MKIIYMHMSQHKHDNVTYTGPVINTEGLLIDGKELTNPSQLSEMSVDARFDFYNHLDAALRKSNVVESITATTAKVTMLHPGAVVSDDAVVIAHILDHDGATEDPTAGRYAVSHGWVVPPSHVLSFKYIDR